MSSSHTVVFEDNEEYDNSVPSKTPPRIKITDRISMSETTGSIILNGQSYGMEAVLHILESKEALNKAFKQVRIKKAMKALGVESKEELLSYLEGE